MMIMKSECCGWDVWGEMTGIVSESGHRAAPNKVTDGPVKLSGTSTDNSRSEQPVPGTQKSDEDR